MVTETVESLCQRARQAVAEGKHEVAKQTYLQALGVKPDSPDVHYGMATVCFLMNDLSNAAYHFKEVTRLDPLRAGAHINLGAVYNRLDQVDEAIQVLRRGIQLDTHRSEGYYNLGLAYRRKKQVDLAIQAYQEAVRLNPKMADALLNLGNAYLEKGQPQQAMQQYRKALEIRPGWEKAENGLAQAESSVASSKQPTQTSGGAATKEQKITEVATTTSVLDPDRQIDPNLNATHLTLLHKATIEADNHGRALIQAVEKEIEPVIKELSSVLLYPSSTRDELDECVRKFDTAVESMQNAHRSLLMSIEHARKVGDRLLKS